MAALSRAATGSSSILGGRAQASASGSGSRATTVEAAKTRAPSVPAAVAPVEEAEVAAPVNEKTPIVEQAQVMQEEEVALGGKEGLALVTEPVARVEDATLEVQEDSKMVDVPSPPPPIANANPLPAPAEPVPAPRLPSPPPSLDLRPPPTADKGKSRALSHSLDSSPSTADSAIEAALLPSTSASLTPRALRSSTPRTLSRPTTPPRTHTEGAKRYLRSPSGSELSELEDSPNEKRRKRQHTFELVIVPRKREVLMRRERSEATSEVTLVDVEEEEEEEEAASSSDSSDGDDVLAAALARAKARRLAGTSLAPTSAYGTPVAFGAPLAPGVRRSAREKKEEKRAKEVVDHGLNLGDVGGKGRLSMAALAKERREAALKGKDELWEMGKRLMEENDLDLDSEDSEDERKTPFEGLTSEHVDRMVLAAAGAVDEDAPSPDKRAAQKQAREMAALLKTDLGKVKAEAQMVGAFERRFWEEGTRVARVVETEEIEGWKGRIAKAIRDGRENAYAFPTPMVLFSSLNGIGSPDEHKEVAGWLLSLICHPTTSAVLAASATNLLNRIISYTAKSTPSSVLLTATDFFDQLELLGAKEALLSSPKIKAEAMDIREDSWDVDQEGEELMETERSRSVTRMLRVVRDLSATLPPLLSDGDVAALVVVLLRLALDPVAAPSRADLELTLQSLVDPIELDNVNLRCEIFEEILAVYHGSKARLQVELLRALPHLSKRSKTLRSWVAWAMLIDLPDALEANVFATAPSLEPIKDSLESPAEGGHFHISKDMDDEELYYRSMILSLAMVDLSDDLHGPHKSSPKINLVQDIGDALKTIDGRIRTDVRSGNPERHRAKNAITRLTHSLLYQTRKATNWRSGFDDEEPVGGKKGGVQRRIPNGDRSTQTTLSFGR